MLSLLRAPATVTQEQITARIGAEIQAAWVQTGLTELVEAGMLPVQEQDEVKEALLAVIAQRMSSRDPAVRETRSLVEAMLRSPSPNYARYYRYAGYLDVMALLLGLPERSLYWTAWWDSAEWRRAMKAELRSL